MADEVTLTAELYDRRDPSRPPVFVAPAGAKVPRAIAQALGAAVEPSAKARKEADVEDKSVKPATKSTRAKKA